MVLVTFRNRLESNEKAEKVHRRRQFARELFFQIYKNHSGREVNERYKRHGKGWRVFDTAWSYRMKQKIIEKKMDFHSYYNSYTHTTSDLLQA